MNDENDYRERMAAILAEDSRYAPDAYDFVRESVTFTVRRLDLDGLPPGRRHVRGWQLLEGFRDLTLEEFGPLSLEVLHEWGIRRGDDVGHIVFNLVRHGLLGASEEDSQEDFSRGFSFEEAFLQPFVELGEAPADLPKIDQL
jgi:uncharacterized repeat protein (TIGR04138 family)